jgi:hypothetical protein
LAGRGHFGCGFMSAGGWSDEGSRRQTGGVSEVGDPWAPAHREGLALYTCRRYGSNLIADVAVITELLDLAIQDGGSMRMGFDGVGGGGGCLGRGSQERRELPFPNLSIPARSEVRSSNFDNHSTTNAITMPYSHDSLNVVLRDAVSKRRGFDDHEYDLDIFAILSSDSSTYALQDAVSHLLLV